MGSREAIFALGAAVLLCFGWLVPQSLAGEPPEVLDCGVVPYLATYGDVVTFWADVSDPDGFGDVVGVWVVYDVLPIAALAETDPQGHYEADWTVPNLPGILVPGDYVLSVVAVDGEGNLSDLSPFVLSITDRDPRVPLLLNPPDGASIWRGMPVVFEWSDVPEATGYTFELTFPDQTIVSVDIPYYFTSIAIQPRILSALPNGQYFWRVRALFEGEPGQWADAFEFEKDTDHGPPVQIEGFVWSVDVQGRVLQVGGAVWQDGRESLPAGRRWIVHVTDETRITKDGEEIGLEQIEVGDYLNASGWLDEGPQTEGCGEMTASEIEVTEYSPPEFVSGSIEELIPEERSFWLSMILRGSLHGPGLTLVRLTDDAEITRMGVPIEFEELAVGDMVMAEGSWREFEGGKYFLARYVEAYFGGVDWAFVEGRIEQIDKDSSTLILAGTSSWGPSIVVSERMVVGVTRSTKIVCNGRPAGFLDLKVGDWAVAEGKIQVSDPGYAQRMQASLILAFSTSPGRSE